MKRTYILYFVLLTFLISNTLFQWNGNATPPALKKNNIEKNSISLPQLSEDINKILSNKYLSKTKYAIGIYSPKLNKYLYKKNIEQSLVPASNSKLVTTYTLLKNFGQDYTLNTDIYTDADTITKILNGNIYLFGKGDGLLSINDLEVLAEQIYKLGVKEIKGNIYSDPTFFDYETERIQYSSDKDIVQSTPPITSISLEKNIATVLVKASSKVGNKVTAQVFPNSPAFQVVIKAKTVGQSTTTRGKKKKKKVITRNVNTISVSTKINKDGTQIFYVSGNLTKNQSTSYSHYIKNPSLVAAGSLKDRLKALGIKVNGSYSVKEMDNLKHSFTKVASVKRDIFEVINIVNKDSDNWLAETLFKTIGAVSNRDIKNIISAQELIATTMKNNHIPFDNCAINDGSGLARQTKVTADMLVHLLIDANKSSFSEKFFNSLAVAGVDGTIKRRLAKSSASNRVLAKTGTHRNVSSLSGRVILLNGEYLFFSFIFNGPNVGFYKGVENSLLEVLTNFEYE